MSFEWKQYLILAEELLQKTEESYLRSAVSRAYYGIFCIVRNEKGYKFYKGPDVHRKVIESCKEDESLKKVGRHLDELRKRRNEADYCEDKQITKDLAERMVTLAKETLTLLENVK